MGSGAGAGGNAAVACPTDRERVTSLVSVRGALRRELHVLAERPELTWQQFHNRLQWSDPPLDELLAAERERRSRPGMRTWMHRYTPLHESPLLDGVLVGPTNEVSGCAVSPDGTLIVSWGSDRQGHSSRESDGTLRAWDVTSGAERWHVAAHRGSVTAVTIGSDSEWAASSGDDGMLKAWDLGTGAERWSVNAHGLEVYGCAVSPDGTWLVSYGDDGMLRVWDSNNGTERSQLAAHAGGVHGCAIGPDGGWVVSYGSDRLGPDGQDTDWTLKVWDVSTGTVRSTLVGHTEMIAGCAISPDGTWIASAGYDGTLRIWDVSTGAERNTFTGRFDAVLGCAISPDGGWVVSYGDDEAIRVWDVAAGTQRVALHGHAGPVTGCAISPDGTRIVSTSADQTLKVWHAPEGGLRATLVGHTEWVSGCAISPDGTWLVSYGDDLTLRVWTVPSGSGEDELDASSGLLSAWALSPGGDRFATATWDGALTLWDVATGSEDRTITIDGDVVSNCAMSPDGSSIVAYFENGAFAVLEAATGAERWRVTSDAQDVEGFAVSPDGSWLVSYGMNGVLKVWDLTTGAERWLVDGHASGVGDCAISPDGTWIVSAGWDRTLKIWDSATGTERATLTGHTNVVSDCAISPDGTRIISAGGSSAVGDRTLKVWDVATGTERWALREGRSEMRYAMSPDSLWIAIADSDGALVVTDLETGEVQELIDGHTHSVSGLAVSPDGAWIASTGSDGTDRALVVWDVVGGAELVRLAMSGLPSAPHFHPFEPVLACSDSDVVRARGGVHLAHLVGLHYGPLVVTATSLSGASTARCPACRAVFQIDHDQLGTDITCPTSGCAKELRINPFVVGDASTVPAPGRSRESNDVIEFYPEGLLHKFGFGDGDMLVELVVGHDLNVDFQDLLVAVVEQMVVPRLDQQVETFTLSATLHNPIRARIVDGEEAGYASVITPQVVEVPVADIIRIARTLPPTD